MSRIEPKISVVIPVYNAALFLEAAVQSILEQTYSDFEVLAVDDGSTDDSLGILSELSSQDQRIKILRNRQNIGIAGSLNSALRIAKGRFIARMDADDISHKKRLELQHAEFSDERLVLCGSNILHVNKSLRPLFSTSHPTEDWDIRCTSLFENPFAHSTVMMRAEVVAKACAYDVRYSTSQDYDLWIRVMRFGLVKNLKKCLVKARRHNQSISACRAEAQRQYSARIQRDYADLFLGFRSVPEEFFYNISRALYISKDTDRINPSIKREPIENALLILNRIRTVYPERSNQYLECRIVVLCLKATISFPLNWLGLRSAVALMARYPTMILPSIVWLSRTWLRHHCSKIRLIPTG